MQSNEIYAVNKELENSCAPSGINMTKSKIQTQIKNISDLTTPTSINAPLPPIEIKKKINL
jgi:hypothetical protein